ncbi:hypothetical protein SAMN05421874_1322 [Nonomuraea maritima]|uniref:N-acetyltransferase n=2 Tax=Nonomuraea maritima TaxID=683260 RepID=A0A1G9NT23_9ACTN|nr:hypothetical protein SAMN05421874_1322 [Nonomuraea maritima]
MRPRVQPRSLRLMTDRAFVPDDFTVPPHLVTPQFRLEPLGPQHNASDHAAWMSSIEHIRTTTPGFPYGNWPPAGGMTLEANLADLQRHAKDFARRRGFTYTVLDPDGGEVIGCVYIYPSRTGTHTNVHSWVRADRAHLDAPLYKAISTWLSTQWPIETINYHPR